MDETEFRQLLSEHFTPMLAGTELGDTKASKANHALVAFEHPCALLMKPSKDVAYRIELTRSQPCDS